MRKVRGLAEVQEISPPTNRKGGDTSFPSATEGFHYERRVAEEVRKYGKVKHGQWFKFRDIRGTAYAQTDVLLLPEGASRLYLIESKLTQKAEGQLKLEKLYVPLCRQLYRVPIFPILIFKNILWEPERMIKSFDEMFRLTNRDQERVLHFHWIGG